MTPMNEKRRAAKNVIELLERKGMDVHTINLNFNRPVITISNPSCELMMQSSLIKSAHQNEQKLIRTTRYKGCIVNWKTDETKEAMFQFALTLKDIFIKPTPILN
ncbi:hypothetical protein AAFX60_018945 [Aliivibrio fischeri]